LSSGKGGAIFAEFCVEQLARLPSGAHRPPPWSMRSHHGTISLAPLDRSQVRDMVTELSAHHAPPRDVMEHVAARTGVPLFVEKKINYC
jgi:predicted ATPase